MGCKGVFIIRTCLHDVTTVGGRGKSSLVCTLNATEGEVKLYCKCSFQVMYTLLDYNDHQLISKGKSEDQQIITITPDYPVTIKINQFVPTVNLNAANFEYYVSL